MANTAPGHLLLYSGASVIIPATPMRLLACETGLRVSTFQQTINHFFLLVLAFNKGYHISPTLLQKKVLFIHLLGNIVILHRYVHSKVFKHPPTHLWATQLPSVILSLLASTVNDK